VGTPEGRPTPLNICTMSGTVGRNVQLDLTLIEYLAFFIVKTRDIICLKNDITAILKKTAKNKVGLKAQLTSLIVAE